MSEPLLNVMKIMLLAGLYLFFVRVLWSVFSELRDPRTIVRKQKAEVPTPTPGRATVGAPGPAAAMAAPPRVSQAMAAAAAAPQAPAPTPAPTVAPAPPASSAPARRAAVAGRLVVIDPVPMIGTNYPLGREITIGRAETNGIMLDDTYVSTVHARIFETNGTYFVEDLASRNGSSLNGVPLVATTALEPGDRLQVGATTMEFS